LIYYFDLFHILIYKMIVTICNWNVQSK